MRTLPYTIAVWAFIGWCTYASARDLLHELHRGYWFGICASAIAVLSGVGIAALLIWAARGVRP